MKIKDQTVKELEKLEPAELHVVYELIQSLKGKTGRKPSEKARASYQKAREALRSCKGSMSDDILQARHDRV